MRGSDLVRVIYHSKPDDRGRRQFTMEWVNPDGPYISEMWKDGQPVGFRRGQVFFAVPGPHLERARARLQRLWLRP